MLIRSLKDLDDIHFISRFNSCFESNCIEYFINHCPLCDLVLVDAIQNGSHKIISTKNDSHMFFHQMETKAVLHWSNTAFVKETKEDIRFKIQEMVKRVVPYGKSLNNTYTILD